VIDENAFTHVPAEPGDHVCVCYRGRAEREALMMAYLRDGLGSGQTCLCLPGAGESARVVSALSGDTDVSLLEVSEPKDAHLHNGVFEPDPMLEMIEEWSRSTFAREDCSFARVVADMSWALPLVCAPFIEDLSNYEARATAWARSYPQSCVCMYDLDRFGGNVICAVIKAHPRVWISGMMLENPYHLGLDDLAPTIA
jgi:hypothetical protein